MFNSHIQFKPELMISVMDNAIIASVPFITQFKNLIRHVSQIKSDKEMGKREKFLCILYSPYFSEVERAHSLF